MRAMRKSNQELHSRAQTLEAENKELHKQAEQRIAALEPKCKECITLTEERTILRRRLDKKVNNQDLSRQTDSVETKGRAGSNQFQHKRVWMLLQPRSDSPRRSRSHGTH
jgi:predicted nuclease with TOPRIM domain